MTLIPFVEFIRIPVFFYKTLGQELLEPDPNQWLQSRLLRILFYAGYCNYNIQWTLQLIFLIIAVKSSSLLDVTAVAPCVGFGFVGNFKQTTLHMNKLAIRRVINDLEYIYPKTRQLQKDYKVESCLKTLRPVMKLFAGLCLFNTIYFVILPFSKTFINMLFNGQKFDYPLGFPMWYPFDYTRNWLLYIITSALQFYAGYVTGVGFLTADLLLVSSVNQLCMHFDYISKTLEEYKPKSREENHKFLNRIISLHVKCLELSDTVDTVFSFSLLLNFFSSSGTICFVGFQMIAASSKEIFRYSVLLVTSLAQIMIICIYGNKLIIASQSVGEAAFGHPWYECDLSYQKVIKLMICRSQKDAAIHAPTFPPISLETFMKVISMSYQFFTVLQTTNDKQ